MKLNLLRLVPSDKHIFYSSFLRFVLFCHVNASIFKMLEKYKMETNIFCRYAFKKSVILKVLEL